jgi:hypothetical protein
MRSSRVALTALDNSRTMKVRFGGRVETLAAFSADGVWGYERSDEPGTPWEVTHLPTGRVLRYAATNLRQARIGTAAGWVLAELDALVAA